MSCAFPRHNIYRTHCVLATELCRHQNEQSTLNHNHLTLKRRGCLGRDRMVVRFTTNYAIVSTDVVSPNLDKGEKNNSM
jgi:hypothetical protein